MQTEEIVRLMVAERDRLNRAIQALQDPLKRRGRPLKTAEISEAAAPRKRRKRRSAAQRKAQSEKMKRYWVQRRKQQKSQQ